MTHVLSRDLNPKSTSAGQEVRVPVTVVEVPHMRVLGVRGYRMTPYGMQAAGEAWLSADQLSCLLYTSPSPRDVEESRMPSSA